jgi:hypothetical protein
MRSWATSSPALLPALVRSAVTASVPAVDTLPAGRCRLDSANVAQDKPYPDGYCGVFATSRYLEVYLPSGSNGLPAGSSLSEIGICPTS